MSFGRKVYERPPRQPLKLGSGDSRAVMGGGLRGEPILKDVKAKTGKRTPTAEEKRWMDAIVNNGCVACDLDKGPPRPAVAVHHILRGGRRIGHLYTLPLCDPGHHQNGQQFGLVSRHPWKAKFEAKYGTELALLADLKVKLGFFDAAEYRA